MKCRKDRTRDDLALVTEEVLKQRIQGVKNEKGVWITPAFPKLIYVLEEDNIKRRIQNTWKLTKLAAECTAKTYGSGLYFREEDDGIEG